MSLFQRIRRPFSEEGEDEQVPPNVAAPAIGERLRERREELGLGLEVIGDALRIRPSYLAAIEQGRAGDLPGPTYAIGFIRAYAQYLGLDSERVLARYKAESAAIHARPDLTLPVPLGERSLPGGAVLLVGLILALCGYGTWYYLSTGEHSRPERVAAVPAALQQEARASGASPLGDAQAEPVKPHASGDAAAAASQLGSGLSTPPITSAPPDTGTADSPNPNPVAGPATAAAEPPASTPAADSGARPATTPAGDAAAKTAAGIDIRALADCWIQVRSDDNQAIVFSRVLKAGETYHVPRPGLLLRTGNAGALAIAVGGKPAPAIGRVGALLRSVALDPEALLAGTAVHG